MDTEIRQCSICGKEIGNYTTGYIITPLRFCINCNRAYEYGIIVGRNTMFNDVKELMTNEKCN